jgi:hypothetical protein
MAAMDLTQNLFTQSAHLDDITWEEITTPYDEQQVQCNITALEETQTHNVLPNPKLHLPNALEAAYNGDASALMARISIFGSHHIPSQPLLYIYALGVEGKADVTIISNHKRIFSASDSIELLSQHFEDNSNVVPLKTISLKVVSQAASQELIKTGPGLFVHIPVCGIGDYRLSNAERKVILNTVCPRPTELNVEELPYYPAISNGAAKNIQTNPSSYNTELLLGLSPGIVSPLTATGTMGIHPVKHICFIKRPGDTSKKVGIAVTPFDTMVIDYNTLDHVLHLEGMVPIIDVDLES